MLTIISGSPSIRRKFFAKQIDSSAAYYYCSNDFSLPRVDCGIFPESDLALEPDDSNPAAFKQSYNNVLEGYKSNQHLILGGTFSKVFLDLVRKDFGEENVRVLNIIRNPSAAYAMGISLTDPELESPIGIKSVIPFTIASAVDSVTLCSVDYVTTVRFEDIIINKTFEFSNTLIPCPAVHNNYNGVITRYEYQAHRRTPVVTAEKVALFNQRFSNFNTSFINCHNDPKLPENIFSLLGYSPLSCEELYASL